MHSVPTKYTYHIRVSHDTERDEILLQTSDDPRPHRLTPVQAYALAKALLAANYELRQAEVRT